MSSNLANKSLASIQTRRIILGKSTVLNCDVMESLESLESESVDLDVCSPPYWGLRDYGVKGQYGLEATFQEYVSKIVGVYHEVKRVLKSSGSCFLNIGDTYSGSGGAGGDYEEDGLREGQPKYHQGESTLPAKNLCMIPERIALGLQDDGWILRNKIIWYKPNHMPSSVRDRFANSFEFVYFFSKSRKYFFNLDAVRIPHTVIGVTDKRPAGVLRQRLYEGSQERYSEAEDKHLAQFLGDKAKQYRSIDKPRKAEEIGHEWKWDAHKNDMKWGGVPAGRSFADWKSSNPRTTNNNGKNPGDVWSIVTEPTPEAHFATYPTKLVDICIRAACPENGIVLDHFVGSGTTLEVAESLNRRSIGIELNEKYLPIIQKRLAPWISQERLDGNFSEGA